MGATKSTGKNTSEKRKESTKKFKKEKSAAKKSNYKIDKFGYKIKKTPFELYQDKNIVGNVLGPLKDDHNLYRRLRFSDQNNIDTSNMSTKEIMSKSFKTTLMSKGYLDPTAGGDLGLGGTAGEKGQVKLPRKQGSLDATIMPIGTPPTEVELSQSQIADADVDDIYTRKRKNKKRGKSMTILSSSQGVKDDKLTLGKKSLLGTLT